MIDNICKYLMIAMLLVCFHFNTVQAADNSLTGSSTENSTSVSGNVKAGSVNNEVRIRINNNSKKAVVGLKSSIIESPDFITNITISPKEIELIDPNNFYEFIVTFDIAKDAPPGKTDFAKFRLSTEKGELEETEPRIFLTVDGQKEEAEVAGAEVEEKTEIPVLKLVKIEGPKSTTGDFKYDQGSGNYYKYIYSPNSSGYKWERAWSKGKINSSLSVAVTYAPLEIIPGKPFHIEAEIQQKYLRDIAPQNCSDIIETDNSGAKAINVYGGVDSLSPGLSITVGSVAMGFARSSEIFGCGSGTLRLTLYLEPVKSEFKTDTTSKKDYKWQFWYKISLKGDGRDHTVSSLERILFRYLPNVSITESYNKNYKLDIGIKPRVEESGLITLTLKYRPLAAGQEAITSLPPFEFPTDQGPSTKVSSKETDLPEGARKTKEADETVIRDSKSESTETGRTPFVKSTKPQLPVSGSQNQIPLTTPPGSNQTIIPETVNPGSPDAAQYIRDWIQNARPPKNAVPGANVRYSPKGNKVGTVPGGTLESRHDEGSAIDPNFLWTNKRSLDSVDHCTMEEYVVAKLNKESISHCEGRYGGVRNLKGERVSTAKTLVENKGFKPTFVPGSPAKSPEEEGTVEKQKPGSSSPLKKGDTIQLVVHSPYVPPGSVLPDFFGKPVNEVSEWLQENNFTVEVNQGDIAPSSGLSNTVRAQEPEAGTTLIKGAKVILTVYKPFADIREVPDLVGQTEKMATAWLEEMGLNVMLRAGTTASHPEDAGRVAQQSPAAGTRVAAGSMVTLTTFKEAEGVEVPDLVGRSEDVARAWLEELGLRPDVKVGSAAHSTTKGGTVATQSVKPGTRLSKGALVTLTVFGDYIAQTASVVPSQSNCMQWPGTILQKDSASSKLSCQCPSGTAWSKVQNRCLELPGAGGGAVVALPTNCSHMPGTLYDSMSGECRCPVGIWDAGQRRCIDTAAIERQKELVASENEADCEGLYSEIRMYRGHQIAVYQQIAAEAERKARAMGCDSNRISEAIARGGGTGGGASGGDSSGAPVPVTGPVEDKIEGEVRVSSRNVRVCVTDVNKVLDDHYDLYVNELYLGSVKHPEGGATCYNAYLRSGSNRLELRLVATRGKSTLLLFSINGDEFSKKFSGSTNHIWNVIAP